MHINSLPFQNVLQVQWTTTLGDPIIMVVVDRWSLFRAHLNCESLIWTSKWSPLLTGGRYSYVVVGSSLAVHSKLVVIYCLWASESWVLLLLSIIMFRQVIVLNMQKWSGIIWWKCFQNILFLIDWFDRSFVQLRSNNIAVCKWVLCSNNN